MIGRLCKGTAAAPGLIDLAGDPRYLPLVELRLLEHSRTLPEKINDIGDAADIHPKNKKEVGRRLALWSLANDYGKDIVFSGPLYKSSEVRGSEIIISFDQAKGLKSRDGQPLKRFEIAGSDKVWHWADAKIDGQTVIVSSPEVPAPKAVRYAWASNPEGANLVNAEGLPASVFRSDNWEIK